MSQPEPTPTAKRHVELRTGTPYANLNAAQLLCSETLGELWRIDPARIIPTFGATGGIEAVRNHILKLSSRKRPMVLTVSPGYWRARESFGGLGFELIDIATAANGFSISEGVVIERAGEIQPDLIYLSLPNNPTGAIFDPVTIINGVSPETAVMFDLTLPCRDLSAGALMREISESFQGRRNLFLAGSTSKSHGTAEYRVGWTVCTSLEDANALRAENRSGISTVAIAEAIKRVIEPPTVLDKIDQSFSLLEKGAAAGRYALVAPKFRTRTTYVLLELLEPPENVKKRLGDNGIDVMWGSEFGLTDRHIRLETIESPNIEIFVEAMNNSAG
jgi:aspartate/methionine/tyrosine aminotransferase